MRVWVYPEKTYEELGAIRWEVEWQELTSGAVARRAADPYYDHDRDRDEINRFSHHATEAEAVAAARAVVNTGTTVYGCATVTKQVVGWFVKRDRVAEWSYAAEPIYID